MCKKKSENFCPRVNWTVRARPSAITTNLILWCFKFHPMSASTPHLKGEYGTWYPFHKLLSLLHHVTLWIFILFCRLKIAVGKGDGARNPMPESNKILVVNCGESNYITMRHVCNKSSKCIERHSVHFRVSGPSNLADIICMGSMV